ncbi:tumor necrosis factor alpha-induced protein 8-like protein isoform X1 [Vespa velutina]|uniref:tumor necrosis factor alpha-induced protein 8-like protein isoform X1 n=3 Tax=Vespa TaxID=7443 RepID=UPI001FB2FBF3|nr:tumor necrosis factor alpha-induced protein 8-like protein isoform X1 [Vespa velutina]
MVTRVAWGTAVMELQSWLLYHLVAVTDCNQEEIAVYQCLMVNREKLMTILTELNVMQSAATIGGGGTYPAGGTGSRARDLGLRAQKKLLGRVVSTGAGRSLLIDDATTSLLDNLYKLMERATKNNPSLDKKQPEKVLKNIVKLSIKVGLLQRNQQLGPTDDAKLVEIRTALRAVAMAVVSFYELEFSFDKAYLTRSLERCRSAIQGLIKPHLTDKSQDRCDQVFDFLRNPEFLDSVFRQDSEHRPILGMLVSDINKALDAGHL